MNSYAKSQTKDINERRIIMTSKLFYNCDDIIRETGYSKSKCYKIIKTINAGLRKRGVHSFQGKVLKSEFKKYCGISKDDTED